jgi:aminopeptidase N
MIRPSPLRPSAALVAAVLAASGLAACAAMKPQASTAAAAAPAMAPAQDPHSYARPAEARVTHVALDLTADFAARRLEGTATLDLKRAPGSTRVILDSKGLEVLGVGDAAGRPLRWTLGASDPILGQPLEVELPQGVNRVAVRYRTSPDAGALQWLTPEQTTGKKKPFLFSQGESILTRSWVPTQDSPGIRQTYSARIVVPEGLHAVMSAEMLTPEGEAADGGRAFRFRMDQPVAPYLIALAVGDLAFKPLGPRTGVWAEPEMLDKVAWEFADLEKMVTTAEGLYGPYRWGRYDILVLPPSFPYGGMENPRLTFATPTVIAGDRSLVSLAAHELAHSWSGNLVTNATWNDFWLNEGFTTYFENRIMEALYGPERAATLRALGWRDLQTAIKDAGGPNSPDTRLHLDLAGRDPDEGTSDIAYEKGAAFLRHIEQAVGRPRFDAWLRSYFDRHAFGTMTTEGFLADLRANLIKGDKALEQKLELERWIYQPGVPADAVQPTAPTFAAVEAQAKAFAAGGPASAIDTRSWSTQEWQHFLANLPETLPRDRLDDLDRTLKLSRTGNSEVMFAWLEIVIRNHYDPGVPALERFLTSQGRRKFVKPLFQDLMDQGEWGRPLAVRIYREARPGYHPVTATSVDAVVK